MLPPRLVHWTAASLVAALAWNADAATPMQTAAPPYVIESFHRRLDDPRAGVLFFRDQLRTSDAQGNLESQFWQQLALSELHAELEQGKESRSAVVEAGRLLKQGSFDDERHRLWLEMRAIGASGEDDPVATQRMRVDALQRAAQASGDEVLLCRFTYLRAFVLHAAEANTEAWAAAEDAEACGRRFTEPRFEVWGLYWRASLATRVRNATPTAAFLERALQLLDKLPARQLKANLLRVMGEVAAEDKPEQALAYLQQMLALCRQLGDDSGAGQGLIEQSRIRIAGGDLQGALRDAREAARFLEPPRPVYRWVIAQALVVELMSRLGRPGLQAELTRLRAADPSTLTLTEKSRVAMGLAKGEAALGRHPQAYADLQSYVALRVEIDKAQRAADVRALAARYDAAARDGENRELRLRAETSRLEIEARDERQHAMLAGLVALAVLLVAAATYGWRVLLSRRRLADLALRDELTDKPNRRAIMAYARQQLSLCQRLRLPFSLAMLDLDHFKRVNDTHGHAGGDAVLKAFAAAAGQALRGQDLLGRFGGEEWLLVMPGTEIDDLAAVFSRLRQCFAGQAVDGLPSPHGVTFSMGGAALATPADTLESLIEQADRCLYAAKHAGRDMIRVELVSGPVQAAPAA